VHCRHRARCADLVEELFRDGLTAEPAARVDFLDRAGQPGDKAIHETNVALADKAGLKSVGAETFAGATKNFSGLILKIKAARPDIIYISSFDAVSVPLVQQMRQLQVQAMDVHHIMASGSLARQVDLEGVTGEIYWHEGVAGG